MSTHLHPSPTKQHPRTSVLDRAVAARLATTEYDRVVTVLEQLSDEQWSTPTECPGWDVRAIAGHLLGMMQMVATVPQMLGQQVSAQRRSKRDGVLLIDALTALQVEKNAAASTSELLDRMRRTAPRAARMRRRAPGPVRGRPIPDEDGWWTFGYLVDAILTRDPFMHRIDIARATGVAAPATAEHEGAIVADVVQEWAGRHGAPYTLELTGPAGGRWQRGTGGEQLSLDAFEFCRILSGRAPGEGLLSTRVPF